MSAHNALEELNREAEIAFDGKVLDFGPTVPTDGTAGFAPSCLFLHTDSTDGAGTATYLFVNVGTAAACNFDGVTIS
tara:strand:- start:7215 stop:7445 length:231 start_codon:yes stop_codon:yes gene_type:complete